MKIFIFAIDDGTVFDKKVIEIFNRYGIKATFNLNSGLQDFVWYQHWLEVRRLNLWENRDIYKNHEVASHSLTHPYLTSMDDDAVRNEVRKDIENLTEIFHEKIESFSFPFDGYDERTINIIKNEGITHIILPEVDPSFKLPEDTFHIKPTAWQIDDALIKVKKFISKENAEFFLYLSHSYDYEYDDTYEKLEKLCKIVTSEKDIKIITLKELNIPLSKN